MKKILILIFTVFTLISCSEPTMFTGLRITTNDNTNIIEPSGTTTIIASYYKDDVVDTTIDVSMEILEDSTGGASFSSGANTASTKSGTSVSLDLGSSEGTYVTVKVICNEITRNILFTTTGKISAANRPFGYASIGAASNFGGYKGTSTTEVTVSTRSELISAVNSGNNVIYVNGMIDMTDTGSGTMLPSEGGGSTTALDNFVSSKSSYSSYSAWKSAYSGSCSASTEDGSYALCGIKALYSAYKSTIQLNIKSNTTIIGLTNSSGIRGASISISGVSNVAMRNLKIQDAYDPFPHHEANDGFNSQYDGICIQGSSSNIWIDHCTFEDTLKLSTASNGEKWQTYDGLCDMKSSCKNITVSYCQFREHDKTMLIGSNDSDVGDGNRTITLYGNYFYNCGQRLPMVRNTKIHICNNYFDASSSPYTQSYAIGCRSGALAYVENNYFGSGIGYSISGASSSPGSAYSIGNTDKAGTKGDYTPLFSEPFTVPYAFFAAESGSLNTTIPNTSGAGKIEVVTLTD